MDLTQIIALVNAAGAALSGPAAEQFVKWATLFISALPGIQAGVISALPFLEAGMKLILNGGQPITQADWDAQLALLQAQLDTVDAQVARDEMEQP